MMLDAGRTLTLSAAQNTWEQHASSSSMSAGAGVSVGFGATGWNVSGSVRASAGSSQSGGNGVSYTNALVTAGGRLNTSSGNDTNIKGANLLADQVIMGVGNRLNVESLQDRSSNQGSSAISMSYVFLKNIFALVLLLCCATSCAGLTRETTGFMETWVDPTPVDNRTAFPREKAWFDARTPTLSRACRQGVLTGKNIRDKATLRQYAAADYSDVPLAATAPDGKSKIYKLYLAWKKSPPPDPFDFYLTEWDYYGFSFTVHTNDEDIITECRVTKQFIGREPRL